MSKKGQHNNDAFDPDKARGPNKPDQSMVITTGSYKKPETYREQAIHHQATDRPGQNDKNEWKPDTREKPPGRRSTRASHARPHRRSGSDSNASRRGRKKRSKEEVMTDRGPWPGEQAPEEGRRGPS